MTVTEAWRCGYVSETEDRRVSDRMESRPGTETADREGRAADRENGVYPAVL